MGTEDIWLIALGGFAGFISNVLYMMGGTTGFGGKWVRRFMGTFVLALSCNLIAVYLQNWVWQFILVWPCLILGMSLGYGGDSYWVKAYKRTIFALGVLSAVLIGVWAAGFTLSGWIVFGLAILVGSGSVILGVLNPFKNAPLEQFLVSQVLTLFIPFLAFINH